MKRNLYLELETLLQNIKKLEDETDFKIKKLGIGQSFSLSKGVFFLKYSEEDESYRISTPSLKTVGDGCTYDFLKEKSYRKIKNNNSIIKEISDYVFDREKVLDTRGSIYLVTDGKYTKIGATSYNVKKRLNELQTGNAKELKLVYSYKVKNKLTTESYLHDMFKEKNVLNEWFELSFENIDEIMNNKYDIKNNIEKITKEDIEEINFTLGSMMEEINFLKEKIRQRHHRKHLNLMKEFSRSLNYEQSLHFKVSKYRF